AVVELVAWGRREALERRDRSQQRRRQMGTELARVRDVRDVAVAHVGTECTLGPMASFFVFKVRSTCLECGESLPFEGPALRIPCRACHSDSDVPAATWQSILSFRENLAEFRLTEGQIRNSSISGGGSGTFLVGWGPQRPVCASCAALLDLSA